MKDKPRRNPLDKERFGEGNRQKWAMVFIAVGLFSLLVAAVNPYIDIAPFMVYFTAIAAVVLAGASGDSMLKIMRSTTEPPPQHTEQEDEQR